MIEIEADVRDFKRAARALQGARLADGQKAARRKTLAPVQSDLRKSARATLPRRGGLGAWVARLRVREQASATVSTVTASHPDGARLGPIDAGMVRHLVYGRPPLVRQNVRAGFASDVFERLRGRLVVEAGKQLSSDVRDIAREASS